MLEVAELMTEASFIQKRREAEPIKVEQELGKAETRVRVLEKEKKVDKSKAGNRGVNIEWEKGVSEGRAAQYITK